MMTYDGLPAQAPPAYDKADPGQYPPTAPEQMYPATIPISRPAPGYLNPETNPIPGPAPGYLNPALNPAPTPAPAKQINMQVGPNPSHVTCPSCRATVVTRVNMKSTSRTHLMALALCLFTCCIFACLPYCIDSCRNADHYCPNCNCFIGSYAN